MSFLGGWGLMTTMALTNIRARGFDGIWGIYDEPYLQYFAQQLRPAPTLRVGGFHFEHAQSIRFRRNMRKFPRRVAYSPTVAYFDYALKSF
jgi:hypothetical protein